MTQAGKPEEHPQVKEAPGWLERLKTKWGLTSIGQVAVILIVFSVTGMSVVFLRKAFFDFLGFDEQTSLWLKSASYIVFVFPAYQVLILVFGFLFGQFAFFWDKEKFSYKWKIFWSPEDVVL